MTFAADPISGTGPND